VTIPQQRQNQSHSHLLEVKLNLYLLFVSYFKKFSNISFFPVHVEDIILHMFQYIQKIRIEGPQEWVFQECKVQ